MRRISVWFIAAGALLVAAGAIFFSMRGVRTGDASAPRPDMVAAGSHLAQTIRYIRCGHEVQRRIDTPPDWVGLTKDGVAGRMDSIFRMTAFSPELIEMEAGLDLFCPQHQVLMLGADGTLGVYHNAYGFAMERMRDARINRMDEELRAELVRGLAFDSLEALDMWLLAR